MKMLEWMNGWEGESLCKTYKSNFLGTVGREYGSVSKWKGGEWMRVWQDSEGKDGGGGVCSVREDTLQWLWLKYGPIIMRSIELQLHSSLHFSAPTPILPCTTHTHTPSHIHNVSPTHMHIGTTVLRHFISSFTTVPCTVWLWSSES